MTPARILTLGLVAIGAAAVLLRQAFARIPAELIDAARVNSMSEMGIAWRVALPLAMPTVIGFLAAQKRFTQGLASTGLKG